MLSIILKSLHSTYLFFLPFENRNSAIAIAEKIKMQPKTRFTETFSRLPFYRNQYAEKHSEYGF